MGAKSESNRTTAEVMAVLLMVKLVAYGSTANKMVKLAVWQYR